MCYCEGVSRTPIHTGIYLQVDWYLGSGSAQGSASRRVAEVAQSVCSTASIGPSVRRSPRLINILTADGSPHPIHTDTHSMPRHHRPRLDVILRVPRHEPYTEKAAADRRKLTNPAPSSQLPTSLSLSSATAASNPDSDQTQQIPLASPSSTSCAEWNSLLIWARRMRGPQWDSGVGMWMVDQGSDEYYA